MYVVNINYLFKPILNTLFSSSYFFKNYLGRIKNEIQFVFNREKDNNSYISIF